MNNNKLSNHVRMIAFFLTAVILICTFGFTVDGWQVNANDITPPSNDKTPNTDVKDDPSRDDQNSNEQAGAPDVVIPDYINSLTGMETTEEISEYSPLAFIMDADDSCYGISRSDILVEIPVENEKTRFISFISDKDNLWKIGSLASGRDYINNIVKYFGGVAIYNAMDDLNDYESCDMSQNCLDLSLKAGYHYTEQTSKSYTNCDLISSGLTSSGIHLEMNNSLTLPFGFNDFGNNSILLNKTASEIKINQCNNAVIQLKFDAETRKYFYRKNGELMLDALNGKNVDFTNCFILFADSVTYDNFKGCQTIVNTIGKGSGFYLTEGTYTEIIWSATKEGTMTFFLPDGTRLTVNRGTSYICYVKSSKADSVIFT